MKEFSTIIICILLLAGCRGELPLTYLELSEDTISCTRKESEFHINIAGRQNWTTDNTADWISIRRSDGNALIHIDENTGGSRQRVVNFLVDGEKKAELHIFQEHSDTFSISVESIQIKYQGDIFPVIVTCFEQWHASCDADWINLDTTDGTGPKEINISISQNIEIGERKGEILFSCGEKNIRMIIIQERLPHIEVERQTIEFDGDGGQDKVLYLSNTEVKVSCSEEWIRIIETEGSIKKVSFEVKRNLSDAREGRIRISSEIDNDIFKEIIIKQGPKINHPNLTFAEGSYIVLSSCEPIILTPVFEDMSDNTLTWLSNSPKIASVDSNGLVNIHSGGICTITATNSYHNVEANIILDIRLKSDDMTVMFGQQIMNENPVAIRFVGETMEISVSMNPSGAYLDDLTYFSSDDSVAMINGNIIHCLKKGKAEIFIESSYQSLRQSYIVTVIE